VQRDHLGRPRRVVTVKDAVGADGRREGGIDVAGAQCGVQELILIAEPAGEDVGVWQPDTGGSDAEALTLGFAAGPEEGLV